MSDQPKDWRKLCEAAAQETDPDKLLSLVIELNKVLDEREPRRDGILRDRNDVFRDRTDRTPRSSAGECAW
jgi:hypothetical protein